MQSPKYKSKEVRCTGKSMLSLLMTVEERLIDALQPYRDTRLLVFNTMQDAFGGFVSEDGSLDRFYNSTDVGIKFQRRLSLYTGSAALAERSLLMPTKPSSHAREGI